MKRALLIIDMLKGFCAPGNPLYCGGSVFDIIPYIVRIAREFRDAGDPIIFLCDRHKPDDPEFKVFPEHCIEGTEQAEIIEELSEFLEGSTIIPKTRFSGFYNTDLEKVLRRMKVEEVHVVGLCTNICVLYTVEELRNRDYRTVVHQAAVASFDRSAHRFALEQMESVLGAELV